MGNELLLYDHDQERAVSLNQSASLIWSHCDGSKTLSQIADSIASTFGLTGEDLLDDVTSAVRELFQNGLIELE